MGTGSLGLGLGRARGLPPWRLGLQLPPPQAAGSAGRQQAGAELTRARPLPLAPHDRRPPCFYDLGVLSDRAACASLPRLSSLGCSPSTAAAPSQDPLPVPLHPLALRVSECRAQALDFPSFPTILTPLGISRLMDFKCCLYSEKPPRVCVPLSWVSPLSSASLTSARPS